MGITFRWEDAIDDIADAEHYASKIDNEIRKLKFYPYHCQTCSKKFMFQGIIKYCVLNLGKDILKVFCRLWID